MRRIAVADDALSCSLLCMTLLRVQRSLPGAASAAAGSADSPKNRSVKSL